MAGSADDMRSMRKLASSHGERSAQMSQRLPTLKDAVLEPRHGRRRAGSAQSAAADPGEVARATGCVDGPPGFGLASIRAADSTLDEVDRIARPDDPKGGDARRESFQGDRRRRKLERARCRTREEREGARQASQTASEGGGEIDAAKSAPCLTREELETKAEESFLQLARTSFGVAMLLRRAIPRFVIRPVQAAQVARRSGSRICRSRGWSRMTPIQATRPAIIHDRATSNSSSSISLNPREHIGVLGRLPRQEGREGGITDDNDDASSCRRSTLPRTRRSRRGEDRPGRRPAWATTGGKSRSLPRRENPEMPRQISRHAGPDGTFRPAGWISRRIAIRSCQLYLVLPRLCYNRHRHFMERRSSAPPCVRVLSAPDRQLNGPEMAAHGLWKAAVDRSGGRVFMRTDAEPSDCRSNDLRRPNDTVVVPAFRQSPPRVRRFFGG